MATKTIRTIGHDERAYTIYHMRADGWYYNDLKDEWIGSRKGRDIVDLTFEKEDNDGRDS